MTAVTTNQVVEWKSGWPGGVQQYPMAAATTLPQGIIVATNSDGLLVSATDATAIRVVGITDEPGDNSAGAAAALMCRVRFGVAKLACTSITQAMITTSPDMYVVDNHTVDDAAGATNDVFAGLLVEFVSTTLGWVQIGPSVFPTSGVTSDIGELNLLDGTVAGTAVASKAMALDANKMITGVRRVVNLAAATQTLTALQSGETFVAAANAVFTLPAAAAGTKGVWYTIICGAVTASTGLSISPNSADQICYITSVDDKDLINTGATDVEGDAVTLVCDGVDGWWVTGVVGIWAKEA